MSSILIPHLPLTRRQGLFVLSVVWVILCLVTIVIFLSAIPGHDADWGDPQQCSKGSPREQADCRANPEALRQFGLPIEYYGIHSFVGLISRL